MSPALPPATRLLLQHVPFPSGARVAFFHPDAPSAVAAAVKALGAGAVSVSHRSVHHLRQLERELSLLGLLPDRLEHAHGTELVHGLAERLATYDTVVIRLMPARVPFHQLLRDAVALLKPGGHCFVVGATVEGVKPAAKAMQHAFGGVQVLAHGGGHRLLRSERPANLDRGALDGLVAPFHDPDQFHELSCVLRDAPLVVSSRPGVFSWQQLDEATELLANTMEIAPSDRVLDLGCGMGVLGAVAGRLATDGEVVLADTDCVAVRAATRTMAASGVTRWRVLPSDVASAVRDERFSVVVSNPPFHDGKATDLSLPVRFIEEAAAVLAPAGRLVLVANRTLPYERELDRVFGNRRTVCDGARFKVLEATRR